VSGICPDCGRTWEDARRSGRLGCPACWDAFRQELSEVVVGFHGATSQPVEEELETQVKERRRKSIEDELRQALAQEDYAKASLLRDKLRTEDAAS
jgi:protein arginine kinase activator